MSWGEIELRNEPELVTVNGLQFRKYQMSWIRDMAKKYNYGSVNEFIIDTVLTELPIRLEKLHRNDACRYPYPTREKLKEVGYLSGLEKVSKLSGARSKVVLDDLEALA